MIGFREIKIGSHNNFTESEKSLIYNNSTEFDEIKFKILNNSTESEGIL